VPAGPATPPAPTPPVEDVDEEEQKKRRRYILLGLLLLLLLLICLGGVLWYFVWRDKGEVDPVPSASTTTPAVVQTTEPVVVPTTTAPVEVTVAIPNVVGQTVNQAKTTLNGAGFENIKVVYQGTDTEATSADGEAIVVAIDPAAGQSVTTGTQIVLYIPAPTNPTEGNG
jgi:beta-lactam-binding protein with PASTA domain